MSAGEDGFVAQVVGALSRALSPLADATGSPATLSILLARLGWTTPPTADVVAAIAAVVPSIERLARDVAGQAGAVTLVADTVSAVTAIAVLRNTQPGADTGAPFNDPAFWLKLPEDLLALLIAEDLEANAPGKYGLLSFLGVLRTEARAADPATGRQAYDAPILDWGVLGRTAASPSTWLAETYGWGKRFDYARFLGSLGGLGAGLGTGATQLTPHPGLLAPYVARDNPDQSKVQLLSLSPFVMDSPSLGTLIKPALLVLPLAPQAAPSLPPDGFLLWPMVSGAAQATVDLGPTAKLTLEGDFQASPLRIQVRPDGTIVENASANLVMSARVDLTPDTPFVMAGAADGTRLVLAYAHFGIGVTGAASGIEVMIEAALDAAAAILDFGVADNFLRGVIGDGFQSLPLAVGVAWSSLSGLTFSGSAEPNLTLDTQISIAGVLMVSAIQIELAPADADGVLLTISADGGLTLGPLALVVEAIGLQATAIPATAEAPGNFGLLDLSFGFKPPTALGIGVDAEGIVSGGGLLSIDADAGRYAGVVSLQMFGVGLTAIGIVETQLPDDPDGWSLFLSVMADFTPVPLGFGFMLSGVGGFMGLNRTLDEVALAEGIREGRVESLLFPEDPLADATRILTDIEAFFPTLPDTYAFGAAARIDWGAPAIVTGEIGVVLVLPQLHIAVVGEIASVLPSADAPLIELHMDVEGYVDPAEATFWVTASIHDSRLVEYALSGDMAMYTSLGEDPYFLLSVGGFNPAWSPPAAVPSTLRSLRRMAAAIDLGADLQVTLESYFAATSNTLQFGADVSAVARTQELGTDFSLEGSFGFDVLIIFTPFSIVAGMDSNVSVKVEGETLFATSLHLHLEGPEPWFGSGTAEFEFLGAAVQVNVAVGGRIADDDPDAVDVWPLLSDALQDPRSWSVPAPADALLPEVTLRPLDAAQETGLWVAPDSTLEVRQRVLPLNHDIEIYGAYVPSGEYRFDVEAAGLVAGKAAKWTLIEDWFAPAQFTSMSTSERLSAPSFEQMDAGIALGVAGVSLPTSDGDLATIDLDYEELVLEDVTMPLGIRDLAADRFGLGPKITVFEPFIASARRTVLNMEKLSVAPQSFTLVHPLDAVPVGRGKDTSFTDAAVARRAVPPTGTGRTRIVPAQSVREEAA
jgi:hypothetical protein